LNASALHDKRQADLRRLRESPRPRVLFVTHAFGGGVQRHIEELAAHIEPRREVLLLRPGAGDRLHLRWLRAGEDFHFTFDCEAQREQLVGILRGIGVARVHVHHIHGMPPWILELPRALDVPYELTLHDYYPVCPDYHLTDANYRYCRETGERGCQRCAERTPVPWGLTIDEWRDRLARFARGAQRVIAPSADCARRIADRIPGVSPVVLPHAECVKAPLARAFRALVPGAISLAKGLDLLEACAQDARRRGLPLHFHVCGFVARPVATWPELPLTISGEYPEGMLPALLAREHGDAILFTAQCPETFSYTLSDALATGLPILASNLGAFPERLAAHSNARLFPWDAEAAEVNDALLALLRESPSTVPPAVTPMTFGEYTARYLSAEDAPRALAAPDPVLAPDYVQEPLARKPPAQRLMHLYEDGIGCGNARSRATLKEYLRLLDAAHDAHRGSVRDLQARVQSLQGETNRLAEAIAHEQRLVSRGAEELREARRYAAELRSSTSWRVTAPLRALGRLLRRGRRPAEAITPPPPSTPGKG